jgi:hypothetical protein
MSFRRPTLGVNDLQSQHPELAKEWHPTKNGNLKPTDVTRSSNNNAWWQCSSYSDHVWFAAINNRSKLKGAGCPFCSGKIVLMGFNDLLSTEPELAKKWHPTKNGILKPSEVSKGTTKKIWWQCSKYPEHEWESLICNRLKYNECPICTGQQVLRGFNDLPSIEPEIAKEWHPTKNENLKSTEFTRSSHKKIWWQCSEHPDHVWDATIKNRSKGSGCPICVGQQVLEGFNDLQSTQPEIANEWHPAKNGDLKPAGHTRFSNKKVWWQCSKHPEHIWGAQISDRVSGRGCPICAEYGFNPAKDAWFYLMQRAGEQQFGITNTLPDRLRTHERNGWTLLEHTVKPAPGEKVFAVEKLLKKWLREEIGLVKGATENWSTTSMEVQSLAELKARSGIETDLF